MGVIRSLLAGLSFACCTPSANSLGDEIDSGWASEMLDSYLLQRVAAYGKRSRQIRA